MTQDQMDPQEALSELARIRLADTDLAGVLDCVAGLAKASLRGAAEVSVTLMHGGNAYTAAFTGQLAIDLDETQYAVGYGPCLHAAVEAVVVSIPCMATDARWPEFTARAVERGAFSSLSIGMPVQASVVGGLNIYGAKAAAFDDEQIALATTFAGFAGVALANANLHNSTAELARHMKEAMAGRAVIEQAKGIIMASRRCSADDAFTILARLSQDTNRKVRDVAAAMVESARRT